MNYEDYSDGELFSLICENDEDAKDILFEKYKYIIDIIIKKYSFKALNFGFEYNDLYQEALVGFSDALQNYHEDKDAGLATFITICVDRRLQNIVRNASRIKSLFFKETLSLDHFYEDYDTSLKDLISDNGENDPLFNMTKNEDLKELIKIIEKTLSTGEYDVYELLINGNDCNDIASILKKSPKQIDNTIQRIKSKIKDILKSRSFD